MLAASDNVQCHRDRLHQRPRESPGLRLQPEHPRTVYRPGWAPVTRGVDMDRHEELGPGVLGDRDARTSSETRPCIFPSKERARTQGAAGVGPLRERPPESPNPQRGRSARESPRWDAPGPGHDQPGQSLRGDGKRTATPVWRAPAPSGTPAEHWGVEQHVDDDRTVLRLPHRHAAHQTGGSETPEAPRSWHRTASTSSAIARAPPWSGAAPLP